MPVQVLRELPAIKYLLNENISVLTKSYKGFSGVDMLKILILNLMPKKIEAENQFLRLLSNSPLKIDVQLLRIDKRESKNTSTKHLDTFYNNFIDIKNKKFDGLIVTGAPLGLIKFCDIIFWSQIKEIVQWAIKNVTSTLFICWSVQAALKILYDVPQVTRSHKLVGIYQHNTLDSLSLLTKGFDDFFLAPHSRNADFPVRLIHNYTDLKVLAANDEIGAYLLSSDDKRIVCVTGHPEYDYNTLANEYQRDLAKNLNVSLPFNYFPENNPDLIPRSCWRSHGYLLFNNWIHYYIYGCNSLLKLFFLYFISWNF